MKRLGMALFLLAFLANLGFSQDKKHEIGEKIGGGVIFFLSEDGMHGLIAQVNDIKQKVKNTNSFEIDKLITDPRVNGAYETGFFDWRLPTFSEVEILLMANIPELNLAGKDYYCSLSVYITVTSGKSLTPIDRYYCIPVQNNKIMPYKYGAFEGNIRLIREF